MGCQLREELPNYSAWCGILAWLATGAASHKAKTRHEGGFVNINQI